MTNIQNEVQKIHNQYGISEMANYKIQLLCEQYAKEYHDSEIKKLNIHDVNNSAEYTRGYRDGWRDCCKDVKEFG